MAVTGVIMCVKGQVREVRMRAPARGSCRALARA